VRFDDDTSLLSICVFNMIKYFSIDQTPVVEFDEWAGVLNLASMWVFQEVRSMFLQLFHNCLDVTFNVIQIIR